LVESEEVAHEPGHGLGRRVAELAAAALRRAVRLLLPLAGAVVAVLQVLRERQVEAADQVERERHAGARLGARLGQRLAVPLEGEEVRDLAARARERALEEDLGLAERRRALVLDEVRVGDVARLEGLVELLLHGLAERAERIELLLERLERFEHETIPRTTLADNAPVDEAIRDLERRAAEDPAAWPLLARARLRGGAAPAEVLAAVRA